MLDHRRVRAVTAVKYLPQRCKFSASTSSHRIHRVQRRKSIVGQIRARFLTSSLAKSIFTPFSAKLTSWAGSLAAKLRVWEAMSFLRHREIYQSDERQERGGALTAMPPAHRHDEFPVGYSLASCSPAELASASPTRNDIGEGRARWQVTFRERSQKRKTKTAGSKVLRTSR